MGPPQTPASFVAPYPRDCGDGYCCPDDHPVCCAGKALCGTDRGACDDASSSSSGGGAGPGDSACVEWQGQVSPPWVNCECGPAIGSIGFVVGHLDACPPSKYDCCGTYETGVGLDCFCFQLSQHPESDCASLLSNEGFSPVAQCP